MNNLVKTLVLPCLLALPLLASCAPPSEDNVTIDSRYTMNAEYFVEFNQSILDIYWPTLTVRNFSNASAYIVFNYSFYVCGVKQTSRDLSRSETMTVRVGTSTWQLVEKYHLAIDSSTMCNNRFLDADDVEFEWRIILIQPSS